MASASVRSPRIQFVDCGASHVAAGTFSGINSGKLRLESFELMPIADAPGVGGQNTSSAFTALSLLNRRCRSVHLSLPAHLVITKSVRTPVIAKAKRAKVAEFEAGQVIPYPLPEVVWDFRVNGDDGAELEMTIAAAKQAAISEICEAADAARCLVERMTPGTEALVNAFRFNYPEVRETVLLLNIGSRSTEMVLINGTRPFVRTAALGGNTVTHSIAHELGIGFSEAEALKLRVPAASEHPEPLEGTSVAVHTAMNAFAQRLGVELQKSSASVRQQHALPAAIYITGGGSVVPTLQLAIEGETKMPVIRYDPWRRVELSETCAERARNAGARVTKLVGLADAARSRGKAAIDLLPAGIRSEQAFRRRQPWLLAAAAMFVAALLPPIVQFSERTERLKVAIGQLNQEVSSMRELHARNRQTLDNIQEVQTRLNRLQRLQAIKYGWPAFLAELQDRVASVDHAWIEKIEIDHSIDLRSSDAAAEDTPGAALRLRISGCILDPRNPQAPANAGSYAKVKRLLSLISDPAFAAVVTDERFDNGEPGLLRFAVSLVPAPGSAL